MQTKKGSYMSNLLMNEKPLMVLPKTATAIGLNEAIILQQTHYWLSVSKNYREGRVWVYKTYKEWQEELPFWSVSTIRRAIENLEKRNLLIVGNFNKMPGDNTKWYTVDYEALENLEREIFEKEDNPLFKMSRPPVQNEQSNTREYTETTSESTQKDIRAKKRASEYSDQFLELWEMYPKKKDKKAANKAFKAAMKRADFETIKKGLTNYVAEQKALRTELTYYKHFSTFMNGDSYNDYQVLNVPQPKRRGQANTGSERQGLTYAELQERIKPELEQSGETSGHDENFFDDEDLPF